ncbi:hypothetical protein FBU59_005091, partial [Linderina macrospora]
ASIFHQGNPETNADENKFAHIAGARSVAFGVLTVLQLNQAFLSRSVDRSLLDTGIRSNMWMVGGVVLSFILYIVGTYVPKLNDWLELVPLGWPAWVVIAVTIVLQIVFSELLKLVLRRTTKSSASYMAHRRTISSV